MQELFDGSWAKYGARTSALRVMDEHRFLGNGEESGQNVSGHPHKAMVTIRKVHLNSMNSELLTVVQHAR